SWAETQLDKAIVSEELVVGVDATKFGPVGLSVPRGSIVRASGPVTRRWLLAMTLAGRLPLLSGRAVVAGLPLGSSTGAISSRVAVASLDGMKEAGADLTPGANLTLRELVTERIRVSTNWFKSLSARRRANAWLSKVLSRLEAASVKLDPELAPGSMDPVARELAVACVALAEQPEIAMIDLGAGLGSRKDEAEFMLALESVIPTGTTAIIGTDSGWSPVLRDTAKVIDLDLNEVAPEVEIDGALNSELSLESAEGIKK
ncbi:MAG: hypothetical protein KF742_09665, partial [Cryobacterium sp.]|nr:hypothetical protein [Cryobacterium sp.]